MHDAAKALAHPLRARILSVLTERVASPIELTEILGEPMSKVAWHVKVLADLGCIELVRTKPKRGMVAHYYAARVRISVSQEPADPTAKPG